MTEQATEDDGCRVVCIDLSEDGFLRITRGEQNINQDWFVKGIQLTNDPDGEDDNSGDLTSHMKLKVFWTMIFGEAAYDIKLVDGNLVTIYK